MIQVELNSPPMTVEYAFDILQNKRSIENVSGVRSDRVNYICQMINSRIIELLTSSEEKY